MDIYLEMVFKLEGLLAVGALKLAQSSRFVVTNHVTLQAVDVGEVLLTNAARLNQKYRGRENRETILENGNSNPF